MSETFRSWLAVRRGKMGNAGVGCRLLSIHPTKMILLLCSLHVVLAVRVAQQPFIKSSLDSLERSQACVPREVHLAVSDDNRDIRATWRTSGTGCPSSVSYGLADSVGSPSLGTFSLRSEGSSYTISEQLMCDAPATTTPFTVNMHTAVMSHLEPGALYWYSPGHSDRRWTFRAPPRAGGDQRVSFIAYGDMGQGAVKARKIPMAIATAKTLAKEMDRAPVGLILHIGDLSYADGRYKIWDSFMEQIEPLAARTPYMVSIGNHEAGPCLSGKELDPSGEGPYQPDWGNYGSESGGECGAMTAHRFVMPGEGALERRGGAFAAAAEAAAAAAAAAEAATAAAFVEEVSEPGRGSATGFGSGSGFAVARRALAWMRSDARGPGAAAAAAAEAAVVAVGSWRAEGRELSAGGDGVAEVARHGKGGDEREEEAEEDADGVEEEEEDGVEIGADAVDEGGVAEAATAESAAAAVSLGSHRKPHNPPFWYSFEYGSVHIVMLSSEHNLERGSTQRLWLEADLASVNRCRTPWVIVALHRPMYVVYPHKDNRVVGDHIRASVETLLLQHKVDLVLAGHVHCYYRTCSAAEGKCVDDERQGIVHVVVGSAGHELSSVEDDQKDWCAEVINDWGFGRFDVDGDTLRVSFIRSSDGRVRNSINLQPKIAPGRACRAHS